MSRRSHAARFTAAIALTLATTMLMPFAQGTSSAAPDTPPTPTCTITYTGSSGGAWNVTTNWSTNVLPSSTDVACLGGDNVVIPSGSGVTVGAVENGSLSVQAPLTLNNADEDSVVSSIDLQAGFTGPSTSELQVSGAMTWDSSLANFAIDGGGEPIVQGSGSTFTIEGSNQLYMTGGSVSTGSPITVSSTGLIATNSPTITTTSTVTVDPGTYGSNGGAGVLFSGAGLIFTGTTSMPDFAFNATGTSSSLTGSNITVSALSFSVNSGATLNIPTGDTVDATSNANTIAGTLSGAGTYETGGTTSITGAVTGVTYSVTGNTSTIESGSSYAAGGSDVNSGSLDIDANSSTGTLDVSGGNLTTDLTNAVLTLTGAGTWSGGEITNTSSGDHVTIDQGAGTTFTISGGGQNYLIGDTIESTSPISITNGNLIGTQTGVITTTSTITFAPGSYSPNGGVGIQMSAGGVVVTGDTTLPNFSLNVTGTTSSITGTDTTLSSNGFSVASGATISIPANDTVENAGGTGTIAGTVSGAGTFDAAGATTITGTVTGGIYEVTGDTSTVEPASSYTVSATDVSSGSLVFDADASTTTLDLSGGNLSTDLSTAVLTINGAASWTGGAMTNSSSGDHLTLSQGAGTTFTISGGSQDYLIGDIIDSASPISISAGDLIGTQTGVITTTSTITFAPGSYSPNGGIGIEMNAGGVVVSGNTTLPDFSLNVTGTTSSITGVATTLAPAGFSVSSGGDITIPSGDDIQANPFRITGGALIDNGVIDTQGGGATITGGTLSGSGTLDGSVTQTGGTLAPGTSGAIGTLTFTGGYNVSGAGILAIALASSSSYDSLDVSGFTSIGGHVDVTEQGGYAPSSGTTFNVVVNNSSISNDSPAISPSGAFVANTVGDDFVLTAQAVSGAPTGATATAGNAQATVTWTPPAVTGGTSITSYTVTATDSTTPANGGETCTDTVGVGAANQCAVGGLTNGDSYTFTVTAKNSVGNSAPSSPSNAVVPATIPGSPTNAQATAGNAQATVTWSASASDGGSPVTSYTVTASDVSNAAHGGQTCTHVVSSGGALSCTVTGLTNGDSYTFEVTATNTVGTSGPSSASEAVVPFVPPVGSIGLTDTRLVVPTTRSTTATCSLNVGTMTSCTVVVKAANGKVIASGSASNSSGAATLQVIVTVTAAGIALAAPAGGVQGKVTATITPLVGSPINATSTLLLVAAHVKVTLSGDVTFATGSAVISKIGLREIKALAKAIAGAKLAVCSGYTDNRGGVSYNLALGLARAKAVCTILKTKVKAVQVKSYGESNPVASNASGTGRAKNRRVVIKITN